MFIKIIHLLYYITLAYITGIIHGDFNEQNILCNKDISGEWYVCAVLDFGDSHYSAYIFELAITMCYMLIQSRNLETGAQVLAGYCSVNPLTVEELLLLKVKIKSSYLFFYLVGELS